MNDLVEHARIALQAVGISVSELEGEIERLTAEIERLTAEIERLRAALSDIIRIGNNTRIGGGQHCAAVATSALAEGK